MMMTMTMRTAIMMMVLIMIMMMIAWDLLSQFCSNFLVADIGTTEQSESGGAKI